LIKPIINWVTSNFKKTQPNHTSEKGWQFICRHEGLELEAYPDPNSPLGRACAAKNYRMRSYRKIAGWENLSGAPWTIGYGNTAPGVKQGVTITQAQAEQLLAQRLRSEFEPAVDSVCKGLTPAYQYDAMVSLAYNIGATAFRKSTVAKMHAAGNHAAAAEAFLLWHSGHTLTERREREKELYLNGAY